MTDLSGPHTSTQGKKPFFWGFKGRLHHFIFILTILSLAALLAWWTVFIRTSIRSQKSNHLQGLEKDMKYLALELGSDFKHAPSPGVLARENRFEIVPCPIADRPVAHPLEPYWPEFCIQSRESILSQIETDYRRKNFMLVGEASFFVLILLLGSFFLYRFIQLERRTAQEVTRFWERSAHEIKTPITGIKAFLQNLKSRNYNIDELAPYVDLALKQVMKQEQLATNVMSGYHLNSRDTSLKLEEIGLKEFLSSYLEKSPLQLTESTLQPDFQRKSEVAVLGHTNSLKVILDNIVDNAIKYCTPGLTLAVDIDRERRKGIVKIKDNGPGIPKEYAENVFRAFKHSNKELPVRSRGTGMGLFIAQRLAKQMGGSLKVNSGGRGQGAELHILLQLAEKNEA